MTEETNNTEELEQYLSEPFNVCIFQDLQQISFLNPLEFFRLFYKLVSLIEAGRVLSVIEELSGLNYTDGIKVFIVYRLLQKARRGLLDVPESPPPALFLLEQEYERLERLAPTSGLFWLIDSESPDERARAAVAVSKLVEDVVETSLRKARDKAEHESVIELRARQSERERLERTVIPEIRDALSSAVGTSKKNPDFTTNRQVLALYYMLKHLQVKNVDKTVQAQFIEFLTGKNYKKIYDSVREVDDIVFIKGGEDAQYVRGWFEKLGLTEIMEDINNLLDKKTEKI